MRAVILGLFLGGAWVHSGSADEPPEFYGKTVDQWIAVLRDKGSAEVDRRRAVLASGFFGADAKSVIPDLQELVHNPRFQREAAQSLAAIDSRPEVRIPRLIERFIKDGCTHLTKQGAIGFSAGARDALVRIGGPAVPALIEVLDGPDSGMRVCAAEALGRIGPEARKAVPSLIRAVAQREVIGESELLVDHAVEVLGRLGPAAKATLPVLSSLVIALYQLAPDGSQVAESWLNKPFSARPGEWIYRRLANRAMVLAAMGRTSLEGDIATRFYLESLESMELSGTPLDDDVDYLEEWIERFGRLGVGARLAVPRLKELGQRANPWVRMWAREALEKIELAKRGNGQSSVPR